MENKQLNILSCAGAFLLGSFFVLSDQAGITANVIGYTGSEYALSSVIGIVMIIASAGLFALQISLENVVKSDAPGKKVPHSDDRYDRVKSDTQYPVDKDE